VFEKSDTLKSICGGTGVTLDLSGQALGADDAKIIAVELKCTHSLSVLNLLNNSFCKEQFDMLVKCLVHSKKSLNSLCGMKPGEETVDLSGRNLEPVDAMFFAYDMRNNESLLDLNISSNAVGELVLPDGWEDSENGNSQGGSLTGLNIRSTLQRALSLDSSSASTRYQHIDGQKQARHPGKPEGAIALANAIEHNGRKGMLTSLNLAGNSLNPEGARYIAEALESNVRVLDRARPFVFAT
jgi:hypothetical protein